MIWGSILKTFSRWGFHIALTLILVLGLTALGCVTVKARDVAIGDSIALGTGHALGVQTWARQGAGSCEIARFYKPRGTWGHILISAGINDGGTCLLKVRSGLHARRVTWIVPAPINAAAGQVRFMAGLYGDGMVGYGCRGGCSRRNFHPASYPAVAAAVKRDWFSH